MIRMLIPCSAFCWHSLRALSKPKASIPCNMTLFLGLGAIRFSNAEQPRQRKKTRISIVRSGFITGIPIRGSLTNTHQTPNFDTNSPDSNSARPIRPTLEKKSRRKEMQNKEPMTENSVPSLQLQGNVCCLEARHLNCALYHWLCGKPMLKTPTHFFGSHTGFTISGVLKSW